MLLEHFKGAGAWTSMDAKAFQTWREDPSDKYDGKLEALPTVRKFLESVASANQEQNE